MSKEKKCVECNRRYIKNKNYDKCETCRRIKLCRKCKKPIINRNKNAKMCKECTRRGKK